MSPRQAEAIDAETLSQRLDEANQRLESLREELEAVQHRELRARADLVRSAQLATLGNLVRGVAHEINTPLGALASNHDVTRRALDRLQLILEDEKVTEDELGEVRKIVRAVTGVQDTSAMAVERMKHVVGSLRSFGRPDRSEVDRVDLVEALHGTLNLIRHELGSSITVIEKLDPIPLVECYAQQVNQVIMNLMMNAVQAMPTGGTLTLGAGTSSRLSDGAKVILSIGDTGTGIAPENLERIFEPGFTTKGERVGMGLGLLICSEIVERHGGQIDVTSEVGVGSTFRVSLPVTLPDDKRPEQG